MKEQFESVWLQAFNRGEQNGFKAIFDFFNKEVSYFCYRLIGDMQEAEDITSTTFMKLFKLYENFNSLDNIKAFLYITARNNCIDYLRLIKRRKTISNGLTGQDFQDQGYSPDNDGNGMQNEMIEAAIIKDIHDAIEKLPNQCRQIFKMLYYEGLKPAEIAKQLSISPETVRSQKRRALELLRIHLSHHQITLTFFLVFVLLLYGGYNR